MYAYIVDSFLQDKKFQAEVFKIESRLAQLGIQGRTEKITVLKNIREAATEAIRRGATTIVAVGNDQTVIKLLPIAVEQDVTLGLIPVGEPQTIADSLGLPRGVEACDALSRRIVRKLDVGKAQNSYFLLSAKLVGHGPVECDGRYTVEATDPNCQVTIGNLATPHQTGIPNDGRLELVVESAETGFHMWRRSFSPASVFPIRKATIKTHSDATLLLDGQVSLKAPFTVEVATKKLGMIVGRGRRVAE